VICGEIDDVIGGCVDLMDPAGGAGCIDGIQGDGSPCGTAAVDACDACGCAVCAP
jgi:hypothetical protein